MGTVFSISLALVPNAAEKRLHPAISTRGVRFGCCFPPARISLKLFKSRDVCKLVIKIPENEIRVAWEINGTQQGCDNHVRMSQLGNWGWWFLSSWGQQKVNYVNISWYYGYYLTPLAPVQRVSYTLGTAKLKVDSASRSISNRQIHLVPRAEGDGQQGSPPGRVRGGLPRWSAFCSLIYL